MIALMLMLATASAPGHAPKSKAQPDITTEAGRHAAYFPRWASGAWQVLAGPNYCAADLAAGPMQFAIEKYWWTGDVRVQVMSSRWPSLAKRSGRRASLGFALDGEPVWLSSDAVAAGNGQVGGFVLDLSADEAAKAISQLAEAKAVGVVADKVMLGVYDLANVREAMEQLTSCISTMREHDTSDPFARRR